jgi:delta14-sterol reductase
LQGPEFAVWRFINGNYLQILTANIIIAYGLAVFVYVRSFGVQPGNADNRELAGGGVSGNMLYDFFIGRELNPPVTIPGWGALDIKTFMEVRPGLLGWIILDFAFVMKQYKTYGIVTDSIILTTLFHTLYVLDCFWVEHNILTQIDITTDGFGFMLAFGDLVWVPFIYSTGARYLSVFPLVLGPWGSLGVLAPLIVGYSIFRLTNTQKDRFRTNPTHPSVSHLTYIETSKGTKLITSGYWGIARHFNYFGDLVQGWAYVLPTGIAGYIIQRKSLDPTQGQSAVDKSFVHNSAGYEAEVVQGAARGWGMIFTYLYIAYFTVLLIHRERRDEAKCARKYGKDWEKYKSIVKYRIVPGIY